MAASEIRPWPCGDLAAATVPDAVTTTATQSCVRQAGVMTAMRPIMDTIPSLPEAVAIIISSYAASPLAVARALDMAADRVATKAAVRLMTSLDTHCQCMLFIHGRCVGYCVGSMPLSAGCPLSGGTCPCGEEKDCVDGTTADGEDSAHTVIPRWRALASDWYTRVLDDRDSTTEECTFAAVRRIMLTWAHLDSDDVLRTGSPEQIDYMSKLSAHAHGRPEVKLAILTAIKEMSQDEEQYLEDTLIRIRHQFITTATCIRHQFITAATFSIAYRSAEEDITLGSRGGSSGGGDGGRGGYALLKLKPIAGRNDATLLLDSFAMATEAHTSGMLETAAREGCPLAALAMYKMAQMKLHRQERRDEEATTRLRTDMLFWMRLAAVCGSAHAQDEMMRMHQSRWQSRRTIMTRAIAAGMAVIRNDDAAVHHVRAAYSYGRLLARQRCLTDDSRRDLLSLVSTVMRYRLAKAD
jgi:hypothetical protein